MTKITNELLEDYAMLYPRIECVKMRFRYKLMNSIEAVNHKTHNFGVNIEHIQLRSIESITRYQLEKVSDIEEIYVRSYKELKEYMKYNLLNSLTVDVLRNWGYASDTINKEGNIITVDELVESGKLKLI